MSKGEGLERTGEHVTSLKKTNPWPPLEREALGVGRTSFCFPNFCPWRFLSGCLLEAVGRMAGFKGDNGSLLASDPIFLSGFIEASSTYHKVYPF